MPDPAWWQEGKAPECPKFSKLRWDCRALSISQPCLKLMESYKRREEGETDQCKYLLLPVPSSSHTSSWYPIDPHQFLCKFSAKHKTQRETLTIMQSVVWPLAEVKHLEKQP